MYSVFRQLENGELVHVAFRDDLEQAVQLVKTLNSDWPGEYEVRDSRTAAVRYVSSVGREVATEASV